MSVSLEQIMSDARLLQARLTERGKLGEALHYEVEIDDFLIHPQLTLCW